MASPLAKGLFQRAIGESGGLFSPMKTLAEAEKEGEKLATGLTSAPIAEAKADAGQSSTPPPVLKASAQSPQRNYSRLPTLRRSEPLLMAGCCRRTLPRFLPGQAERCSADRRVQRRRRHCPGAASCQHESFHVHWRRASTLWIAGRCTAEGLSAGSDEEAVSSFYSAYRDQEFGWEMRTWARMATRPVINRHICTISAAPAGATERKAAGISCFGDCVRVWNFCMAVSMGRYGQKTE